MISLLLLFILVQLLITIAYQVSTHYIISLKYFNFIFVYFNQVFFFLLFQSNNANELNFSTDVRGLFGANNK
jgi:hypothetical protein